MKKTFIALLLVYVMFLGSIPAYASSSAIDEATSVQLQADALIAEVDTDSLLADAVTGTVDYSVPLSVRESIIASAEFTPVSGISKNEIKLEVSSTVQKVGEITRNNGETSNLYVAVAAAVEPKEDWEYTGQHCLM